MSRDKDFNQKNIKLLTYITVTYSERNRCREKLYKGATCDRILNCNEYQLKEECSLCSKAYFELKAELNKYLNCFR